MSTKYNSRYKLQIIQMIAQGYDNRKIFDRLGCNIKLPQVTRRWWEGLTPEEQGEWLARANARYPEKAEEKTEEKKPAFRTPTDYAKGRYIFH